MEGRKDGYGKKEVWIDERKDGCIDERKDGCKMGGRMDV